MKHERVLITVKTYPTLSASHIELVCTAGLREDGSWVRIYPIPFRLLDEASQFPKWTWVELPLVRRTKDKRPESFSPSDRENIKVQNVITTADNWRERRRLLFKKEPAWTNLSELIDKGKDNSLSLAVFKPKRLLGLEIEPAQGEWDEKSWQQSRHNCAKEICWKQIACGRISNPPTGCPIISTIGSKTILDGSPVFEFWIGKLVCSIGNAARELRVMRRH